MLSFVRRFLFLNLIMQPVFISHILFMGQISGLALFKTCDVKGIP